MSVSRLLLAACSALLLSWGISMLLGRLYIRNMKKKGVSQPINPDVPQSHEAKEGTPTAGGIFFLFGSTISISIFTDIRQPYVAIFLVAMWSYALIGLLDDFLKTRKRETVGLRTSRKLALQILVGAIVLWMHTQTSQLQSTIITLPWDASVSVNMGMWYPLAFLLYLVMFVNAVNITDGLDGLAGGSAIAPLLVISIIAAVFGFGIHTSYIQIPIATGSLPLLIALASCIGGLLAFLWFNGPKAQVFMGDCGSHALGAIIAISALLLKIELTVLVASAVFVVECLSSLIQIISLRLCGKKVFLLAPLHHHYEKKEVTEIRIVHRFIIISVLSSVLAGLFFLLKYW